MATMSRYCKAYPISRLREFQSWTEKISVKPVGNEPDAYVFVHEGLVVTADVFVDRDIVFDSLTPEWTEFCTSKLGFSIPPDVAKLEPPPPPASKAAVQS